MHRLKLDCHLDVPVDALWPQLLAAHLHAAGLPSVRTARVLSAGEHERITEWTVLLRGSPLRWSQVEQIDPGTYSVQFRLVRGDPKTVNGAWSLRGDGAGTVAAMAVEVDFGLPRIAAVFDVLLIETLNDLIRGLANSAVRAARPRTPPLTDATVGTEMTPRPEER